MSECVIGVDLGGTKIKAGIINSSGQVLDVKEIQTASSGDDIFKQIVVLCSSFFDCWKPTRIGIGTPGLVAYPEGKVLGCTPNLKSWKGRELKSLFSSELSLPVLVDNDANMAAYAEWKAGSGIGFEDLVVLTLGTGLGSGTVQGSQLCRGRGSYGIGYGHMIVEHNGRWCNCGQQGCLETYVSGRGLYKTYRLMGGSSGVYGPEIFSLAESGDRIALHAIQQTLEYLAVGIASIMNTVAPQRIILGGGMSRQGEKRLLQPLRKHVEVIMSMPFDTPEVIQLASLGAEAGMIGAGLMALEEIIDEYPTH